MRLIIAGSREYNDYKKIATEVNRFLRENDVDRESVEIIVGCARDADYLGERYAINNALRVTKFPPNWNKYCKRAGFIRNEEMAKYAMYDHGTLFAFWDGKSHGTKSMLDLAHKYHLDIHIFKPFGKEEINVYVDGKRHRIIKEV